MTVPDDSTTGVSRTVPTYVQGLDDGRDDAIKGLSSDHVMEGPLRVYARYVQGYLEGRKIK